MGWLTPRAQLKASETMRRRSRRHQRIAWQLLTDLVATRSRPAFGLRKKRNGLPGGPAGRCLHQLCATVTYSTNASTCALDGRGRRRTSARYRDSFMRCSDSSRGCVRARRASVKRLPAYAPPRTRRNRSRSPAETALPPLTDPKQERRRRRSVPDPRCALLCSASG